MFTLMDCTLRDGNHAVGLSFRAADIRGIVKGLCEANINYIEVGHPMGLGTARKDHVANANVSDEECFAAVADFNSLAKLGTFFLPSVGEKSDILFAKEQGMKFIRIGSNVGEVGASREFVAYARKVGLTVFFSLMKAYAVPPAKLLEDARAVESYGAQVIYMMDSAGAMLDKDVRAYVSSFKQNLQAKVGFHAHDNLRLGVSNTIAAIEEGADFVDGSLRGLGRSAGNAQTEVLLAVLKKTGYEIPADMKKAFAVGEEYVLPYMEKKGGLSELDIIFGYAGFHSNFLKMFMEVSEKYGVDLSGLIIRVCKLEQVNPTRELVEKIASEM